MNYYIAIVSVTVIVVIVILIVIVINDCIHNVLSIYDYINFSTFYYILLIKFLRTETTEFLRRLRRLVSWGFQPFPLQVQCSVTSRWISEDVDQKYTSNGLISYNGLYSQWYCQWFHII